MQSAWIFLSNVSMLMALLWPGDIGKTAPSLSNHFTQFAGKGHPLPGDQVVTIYRDGFGFLWLGTQRGLIRFDGESIRWYRHDPEDPASLSSADIQVILEDEENRFWIGTSEGLDLLDRKTGSVTRMAFGSAPGGPGPIWSLAADGSGGLWIGGEGGLFHADPNQISKARRIGQVTRISALAARDGQLYVGSDGSGLFHFDRGVLVPVPEFPAQKILDLMFDRNGKLWIATTAGLWGLSNPVAKPELRLNPGGDDQSEDASWVTTLASDSKQRVWAGTRRGLFVLDGGSIQAFENRSESPQSLSDNRIASIYIDHENILWVSTLDRQLAQLNLNLEKMAYHPMAKKGVQTILVDPGGSGILAGTKGGLAILEKPGGEDQWIAPNEIVRHLVPSLDGGYYAATDRGLFKLDEATGTLRELWVDRRVWRLAQAGPERLILGTDQGLYEYQPGQGARPFLRNLGEAATLLGDSVITAIEPDENGEFWLGTFGNGVYRWRPRHTQLIQYTKEANHLSANDVVDLILDRDGFLWVATLSGGLNRMAPDSGEVVQLNTKSGFPDNAVVCVLQDKQGTMWANTGAGIVRFTGQGQDPVVFSRRDGNLCGAAMPGSGFYHAGTDTLYFGGTEGMVSFQAGKLQPVPPPKIMFTSFKANGRERRHLILPGETLDLQPVEAPFSVDYAVLDYLSDRQYRYGYRRQAVDSQWVFTQSRGPIHFTGNMTFGGQDRLLVRADSEVTGSLQAQIELAIAPPAWLRWLPVLIAGFTLLLGSVIYLAISRFERKKRRKLEEQARFAEAQREVAEEKAQLALTRETIEREKRQRQETHALILQEHLDQVTTEIANALHDGPLSMLQGLRFSLKTAGDDHEGPNPKIVELADSFVPEISKKLRHLCGRLLKPQLDQGLVAELETIARSFQSHHPEWQMRWQFDPQCESLTEPQKVTLIRIFRNLMSNAAKHAHASEVSMALEILIGEASLSVTDNGRGFIPPSDFNELRQQKHYGLYMVAYFASAMGGHLQMDTSPGSGAKIAVTFPRTASQAGGNA